jgi:hypothetical protein
MRHRSSLIQEDFEVSSLLLRLVHLSVSGGEIIYPTVSKPQLALTYHRLNQCQDTQFLPILILTQIPQRHASFTSVWNRLRWIVENLKGVGNHDLMALARMNFPSNRWFTTDVLLRISPRVEDSWNRRRWMSELRDLWFCKVFMTIDSSHEIKRPLPKLDLPTYLHSDVCTRNTTLSFGKSSYNHESMIKCASFWASFFETFRWSCIQPFYLGSKLVMKK